MGFTSREDREPGPKEPAGVWEARLLEEAEAKREQIAELESELTAERERRERAETRRDQAIDNYEAANDHCQQVIGERERALKWIREVGPTCPSMVTVQLFLDSLDSSRPVTGEPEEGTDLRAALRKADAEVVALADAFRERLETLQGWTKVDAALYVQGIINNAKPRRVEEER